MFLSNQTSGLGRRRVSAQGVVSYENQTNTASGEGTSVESRLAALEKEIDVYRRAFIVTPTQIIIRQSVLVEGLLSADKVYTKRTGNYVQLTT